MPKSKYLSAMAFIPVAVAILNEIETASLEPGFSENEAERVKDIVVRAIAAADLIKSMPEKKDTILRIGLSAVDIVRGISELTAMTDEEVLDRAAEIAAAPNDGR